MSADSAFTAIQVGVDRIYSSGETIQFGQTLKSSNYYDTVTSTYTCPATGIYYFRYCFPHNKI